MADTKRISPIVYLLGSAGYTIPFYLSALYLIHFYLPPAHENLKPLLPTEPVFGGVGVLALILIGVRLWDIIVDPWIAHRSDRSRHRRGRRLPFLEKAALPAAAAGALLFFPPNANPGPANIIYVTIVFAILLTALSAFLTPLLAHMTSVCSNEDERLRYGAFQGGGEALGILTAGQAPLLWTLFESLGVAGFVSRQWAFVVLCVLAFVLMLVPIFALRGRDALPEQEDDAGLLTSFYSEFASVLRNRDFAVFLLAFAIFMACVEMVQAGAVYYATVLLELDDGWFSALMAVMVPSSLGAVPVADALSERFGKKAVILGTFVLLGVLLMLVSFLGEAYAPIPALVQAFVVFFLAGLPLGSMLALTMAVVADCADRAGSHSSDAMFVAGRNFSLKTGVTLGAGMFASFALLGRDRGDDFGIRLSCWVGAVLIAVAFVIFAAGFRERSQED